MSGYIPANTNDPSRQDNDEHGVPLRPLFSSPDTLYSEFGMSESTAYNSGASLYGDEESLLKDPSRIYTSPIIATPPTPGSPPFSPPLGDPRRHSAMYRPECSRWRHEYRTSIQGKELVKELLWRLLYTIVICGGMYGLLRGFQDLDILNEKEKYMFNALNVAISLLLSLNIITSLKDMANMFRWRFYLWRAFCKRVGLNTWDVELFYVPDSPVQVGGEEEAFFSLLIWVILGVGIQVILALLGLCYSHESDGAITTVPGLVNVTKLNVVACPPGKPGGCLPDSAEQNYRANLFGIMSEGKVQWISKLPVTGDPDLIHNWATNTWMYKFQEYAVPKESKSNNIKVMAVKTSRHINITTTCDWYPIVEGQAGTDGGAEVVIEVNGTKVKHPWANQFSAAGKTVWMNPNARPNKTELKGRSWDAKKYDCGPRCAYTFVYHFLHGGDIAQNPQPVGDFLNCTATFTEVFGALIPEHTLHNNVAQRTAAAIGSSADLKYDEDEKMIYQYNVVDGNSMYDTWDGLARNTTFADNPDKPSSNRRAAFLISRFAIGSISVLDTSGERVQVKGLAPSVGVRLEVKWNYVYAVLGGLIGAQVLAGIVTLKLSNTVVCKDTSFWSTARLLRPIVARMGETGSAATGAEIADMFHNQNMRYGFRKDSMGRNYLAILLDAPDKDPESETKYVRAEHFPNGWYE
ncbi:Similar to hypothetical protein [Tuber melanosporum Mel28]; acc. no. XP_002836511 [Pyronema omphalodes CBS 100304]|uniref:Uncharacterized protein n=1 Tax=Pyronema omphalodes (strain CBS 100304) TaxID=1076935 RepID=U4LUR8_PYROM|nr:Similar to hypothetical protein [Tuber melanosporum Mel28]; acc. no. XP_002836511 [Pyronema omphalodes CBS 100304]